MSDSSALTAGTGKIVTFGIPSYNAAADMDHCITSILEGSGFAPDKIAVQVNVGVVERLAVGQRHVRVDVVHIKRVRRQREVMGAQHVGAVAQTVHEQVLIGLEVPDLVPPEHLLAREHMTVVDGRVRALVHLLVHVVRDEQVHARPALLEAAQDGEHGGQGAGIQPVVGIDDLVVGSAGLAQAGAHGDAVAAVVLMDGADDTRVASHPLLRLGGGAVRGAVVHDDDLDVAGTRRTLQDGRDATVQVRLGVVAGNPERHDLVRIPRRRDRARRHGERRAFGLEVARSRQGPLFRNHARHGRR